MFFVRDGIKFPDLIRSLRPNPKNHLQEGWRILDFLSHHPESNFIVCILYYTVTCTATPNIVDIVSTFSFVVSKIFDFV